MEIKNRKIDAIYPLIIAIALVGGIWIGVLLKGRSAVYGTQSRGLLLYKNNNKITQTLDLALSSYMDSLSSEKLQEDAITGLLKNLDPHSQYIPASQLTAVNEPIEGNFSGIGIQFNMMNDTVAVVNVIPKGPSDRAGIIAGDRIMTVNGEPVTGMNKSSSDITKLLRGSTGTKVKMGVFRRGEPQLVDFEIVREKIPLYSIDAAYMATPHVGYIKINSFSKTTFDEFTRAVATLQDHGMKQLVIDLRDNSGGLIEPAINIAESFLPKGTLLVYTEGRKRPRTDYLSRMENGAWLDTGLALLVNEGSASASEILAGAIQDNDRGIIIGRRSFGKGLVQEQHTLMDGSALRITVSRYYTPTGRSIQKPYDNKERYFDDLNERYRHGEMAQADSTKFNDSLKYVTPKGKTVYGGGGIMPDIFIPIDTSFYSDYYDEIMRRGLLYHFTFDYTDRRRKELSALDTPEKLEERLRRDGIMERFIRYAATQNVVATRKDLKVSGDVLENMVIAQIVRNMFDNSSLYPVINRKDAIVQKAIEVLTVTGMVNF
ncbi:MAG: S41 family peptidase [Bacteroidales bacterium]|jgi:carboxyl-terminal processing protease|nr:S41 family peptidase [Bacteroidales bacterium]